MRLSFFIFFILFQPAFAETTLDCTAKYSSKVGDNTPYPYQSDTDYSLGFNGETLGDLKSKMYDPEEELIRYVSDWFQSKHCKFDGDVLDCNKTDPYDKRNYDRLKFDFGDMTFTFNTSYYYEYGKFITLTWGSGRC